MPPDIGQQVILLVPAAAQNKRWFYATASNKFCLWLMCTTLAALLLLLLSSSYMDIVFALATPAHGYRLAIIIQAVHLLLLRSAWSHHHNHIRACIAVTQQLSLAVGVGMHHDQNSNSWAYNILWQRRLLLGHISCTLLHVPASMYWTAAMLSWLMAALNNAAGLQGMCRGSWPCISSLLQGLVSAVAAHPVSQAQHIVETLCSKPSLVQLLDILLPGMLLAYWERRQRHAAVVVAQDAAGQPAAQQANAGGSASSSKRKRVAMKPSEHENARPSNVHTELKPPLRIGSPAGAAPLAVTATHPTKPTAAAAVSVAPPLLVAKPPITAPSGPAAATQSSLPNDCSMDGAAATAAVAPKAPLYLSPVQPLVVLLKLRHAGDTGTVAFEILKQQFATALQQLLVSPVAITAVTPSSPGCYELVIWTAVEAYGSYAGAETKAVEWNSRLQLLAGQILKAWPGWPIADIRQVSSHTTAVRTATPMTAPALSVAADSLAAGLYMHPVAGVLPRNSSRAVGATGAAAVNTATAAAPPAKLGVDSSFMGRYKEAGCSTLRVVVSHQPGGSVILDEPWQLPVVAAGKQSSHATAAAGALSCSNITTASEEKVVSDTDSAIGIPRNTAELDDQCSLSEWLDADGTDDVDGPNNVASRAATSVSLKPHVAEAVSTVAPTAPPAALESADAAVKRSRKGFGDNAAASMLAGAPPVPAANLQSQVLSIVVMTHSTPTGTQAENLPLSARADGASSEIGIDTGHMLTHLPLLMLPAAAQAELQHVFDAMVASGMQHSDAYQQLLPLMNDWALLVVWHKSNRLLRATARQNSNTMAQQQQQLFRVLFKAVAAGLAKQDLKECYQALLQLVQVRPRHAVQQSPGVHRVSSSNLFGVTVSTHSTAAVSASWPPSSPTAMLANAPLLGGQSSGMLANVTTAQAIQSSSIPPVAAAVNATDITLSGRKVVHARRRVTAAANNQRHAADISAPAMSKDAVSNNTSIDNSGATAAVLPSGQDITQQISSKTQHPTSDLVSMASRVSTNSGVAAGTARIGSTSTSCHTSAAAGGNTAKPAAATMHLEASCALSGRHSVTWTSTLFGFADPDSQQAYAVYRAAVLQHHDFLAMLMWFVLGVMCKLCNICKLLGLIAATKRGSFLAFCLKFALMCIGASTHGVLWLAARCQAKNGQQQLTRWQLQATHVVQWRGTVVAVASAATAVLMVVCYCLGGQWKAAMALVVHGLQASPVLFTLFNFVVQPLLLRVRPVAMAAYLMMLGVLFALYPPLCITPQGAVSVYAAAAACSSMACVSLAVSWLLEVCMQKCFVMHEVV